ncbi:GIY-YIG nuclease family protein [Curvibacter sp. HBC61]|uniref:GIY-YIG nuclease family protein n=1 Tax=Curvibacter cyanobacteriorum TaxID=3026422 RepID=A0ABT5N3R9_9BURK|nr:GIY-YIG nuclease family protein [Curvibacter sp. HBC61]MDD0840688.1 GIY-YIG nuclease family protein [Curvibacter sp. HBC61]
MSDQYIYILINPSLKGLLKIGRTNRRPEERAQELSATSGVPQPFIVAYEAKISDSVLAEQQIHSELTRMGHRNNPAREFFELPLKDAVAIVDRICSNFLPTQESDRDSFIEEVGEVAQDFYELGCRQMDGDGDEWQSFDDAVVSFQRAIAMGNKDAYIPLADIYLWGLAGRADLRRAVDMLNAGAKAGNYKCYLNLWEIYSGNAVNLYAEEHVKFSGGLSISNAEKAYGLYFDAIKHVFPYVGIHNFYRYLSWRQSFLDSAALLVSPAAQEAVLKIVQVINRNVRQLRLSRISGVARTDATDAETRRDLSLGILLEFHDKFADMGIDSGAYIGVALEGASIEDLCYAFSTLPQSRAEDWVATFSKFLRV